MSTARPFTLITTVLATLALLPFTAQANPIRLDADQKKTGLEQPHQGPDYRPLVDLGYRLVDFNPAETTDWLARVRLPSLRLDIGSNIATQDAIDDMIKIATSFSAVANGTAASGSAGASMVADFEKSIDDFFNRVQNGLRLDYEVDLGVVGFSGKPFAALQIADRPLSLGLQVGAETRGYFTTQFSSDFRNGLETLGSTVPQFFRTDGPIQTIGAQASSLITESTSLAVNVSTLLTEGQQILQSNNVTPQDIQRASTLVSGVITDIDQLIGPARQVSASASTTTKAATDLLSTLDKASKGGVKIDTVNDLHGTVSLSGAYPVFENTQVKISVGTNLKLFILPFNIPLSSFGLKTNGNANLFGQIKLNEVQGLSSLTSLQNTVDQVNTAIGDVNTMINQAEVVKNQLQRAQNTVTTDNLGQLATEANSIIANVQQANGNLTKTNQSVSAAINSLNTVQQDLARDLRNVRLVGTVATPSGTGFGMDFGVEATINRDLRLGLMLQNPLVLWSGTESPVEIDSTGQVTIQNAQAKAINYTGSVPLAVLLSGQYNFDRLLPNFSGLYANGTFEYIANGRTPAFTLAVQKQLGFGYVGLGGRLGGITNSFFAQAGLRTTGSFGLDFQLGLAPGTGIPGLGVLNMGQIGMYLLF